MAPTHTTTVEERRPSGIALPSAAAVHAVLSAWLRSSPLHRAVSSQADDGFSAPPMLRWFWKVRELESDAPAPPSTAGESHRQQAAEPWSRDLTVMPQSTHGQRRDPSGVEDSPVIFAICTPTGGDTGLRIFGLNQAAGDIIGLLQQNCNVHAPVIPQDEPPPRSSILLEYPNFALITDGGLAAAPVDEDLLNCLRTTISAAVPGMTAQARPTTVSAPAAIWITFGVVETLILLVLFIKCFVCVDRWKLVVHK